jgi:hypothetical protein
MNIYWPVFKNLESEFSRLMYDIHIDDNQLTVYSSKIADLILRGAVETESISKELYYKHGGTKTGHIRYDDDALDYLTSKWKLDQKTVIISSPNCFLTNKTLLPFVKNEQRTGKNYNTFSWNNSYQNIKHDRGKSITFGSVKYLFDILAALYVLNLYYLESTFPLEKDSKGNTLSPSLGSEIFSVVIFSYRGRNGQGVYQKTEEFHKCIYYIDQTEETAKIFNESLSAFQAKINELAFKNPKVTEYLRTAQIPQLKSNWLWDALGQESYISTLRQAQSLAPLKTEQIKYEAKLNTNTI